MDEENKKTKKNKKSNINKEKIQSKDKISGSVDNERVVSSINFLNDLNYDGTVGNKKNTKGKTKKKEKKKKKDNRKERKESIKPQGDDHLLFEIGGTYRSKTPIHFIQETNEGQGISYKQFLQSEWLLKDQINKDSVDKTLNYGDDTMIEILEIGDSKENIISQIRKRALRNDFKKIFKIKVNNSENINLRSKIIIDLQMKMLLFALKEDMEFAILAKSYQLFERLFYIKKIGYRGEKEFVLCDMYFIGFEIRRNFAGGYQKICFFYH
eukprot:TRINITY_DN2134_c1_g1_i1.p1 TRINITY_DN2134_c1_g1~~TRINITY_DN2134_c1_g1_i1.p1  ORF type:complete len:268 (+),score=65.54 TRINITY_DN2134_c1_g1_i1:79-882(+)